MEDSSFDRKMKSALEGYEDTTPASLGWERFQGKYGQSLGVTEVRQWLKLSAVVNILLTGTVIWLLWNVSHLQDRVGSIENQYPATPTASEAGNETGKTSRNEIATEATNTVFTNENSAQTASAKKSTVADNVNKATATEAYPAADQSLSELRSEPPAMAPGIDRLHRVNPFYKANSLDGVQPVNTHLVFVSSGKPGEAPQAVRAKPAEAHLPMQTVVALEKNKMGNKIGWAFGLTGGGGVGNFGSGYQGLGIQKGIAVGALLHPLWGIESGVSFDQNIVVTKNSQTTVSAWTAVGETIPPPPIDKVVLRQQTLEIPLMVRFRLPVSDRKSFFASLGAVQNFRLSEKQTFYIQRPESHEEYETHSELDKKEFSSHSASTFYTGIVGEVGLSRQIKELPLRWQLSTYYKHNIGQVSGSFIKAEMIGIKGALRFSRW